MSGFYTCDGCGALVVLESGFAHACATPTDPTFALSVLEMRLKVMEEEKQAMVLQISEAMKACTWATHKENHTEPKHCIAALDSCIEMAQKDLTSMRKAYFDDHECHERDMKHLVERTRERDDALRLNQELQKKLADEERSHEQTITDRDTFEEALTDLAADAGCEQEWSNVHFHDHCITDLWIAKVDDVLRWAHTMLCPQSSSFRDGDCICDATFNRHKTERPKCDCEGDEGNDHTPWCKTQKRSVLQQNNLCSHEGTPCRHCGDGLDLPIPPPLTVDNVLQGIEKHPQTCSCDRCWKASLDSAGSTD